MENKPIIPELNPIKSSHLKSVGYDESIKTLYIQFRSGDIWSYSPITNTGYAQLKAAPSAGKYFSENIKFNKLVTATKISSKKK